MGSKESEYLAGKALMEKMAKVIDTSPVGLKAVVERHLSLANRRINECFEHSHHWGLIGGSTALLRRFEAKFGPFIPKAEAVSEETKWPQGGR